MVDLDNHLKPQKSGARLIHNSRRSELLRLEDPTKPHDPPYLPCGLCLRRVAKTIFHTNKVMHIYVREDGTVENESVSAGVFEALQKLQLIGPGPEQFSSLGEITNPPTIGISPALLDIRITPKSPGGVDVLAS